MKELKIIRLKDKVNLLNCSFVFDHLKGNLPDEFSEYFKKTAEQHSYNTRGSSKGHLVKTMVNSTKYGLNSVKYRAISDWNKLTQHTKYNVNLLTKRKFMNTLKSDIFSSNT